MLIIYIVVALLVGLGIGYMVRKVQVSQKMGNAEHRVEKMLEEAKSKEKEILLEAKSKALELTEAVKKQENEFRQQILRFEQRSEKKEIDLDQKSKNLEDQRIDLEKKNEETRKIQEEMREFKLKQIARLEEIAAMTREEAKKLLLDNTEKTIKEEMLALTRKTVAMAREDADRTAKEIVAHAIERCASEVTAETTTTIVHIPSEEMKGRIIGKEGRNIRSFEQMMGVEILIDDSPDTVVISGFNSIRRQIAKLTLEKLLQDGRIHPARIEEAYEKSKQEVGEMIKLAGEEAVYELGITSFPPKLIQLIGRLRFRTSYGQNILRHSVEMAKLSALMAEELGADVMAAKQGALLHDIGKALDQDMEGTHVEIGRKIAEKFNLNEKIINAITSHHGDTEYNSIESIIIDAADNISGARPGARKDTYENYVKRLEDLENIANSYEGVEKTYAIQAGREIRVFVHPDKIDDWAAQKLARDIANRFENELKYPGEIRVNVIREKRVIEYAR
ncbi:MAG: ribonuclease [Candidatus Doudnabacteria bacterium]|nr:ribonuclease [Candidatus Doudnabacteria bacterium]